MARIENRPLVLLFGDEHGIYIPKMFATDCNPENTYWVWSYLENKEILLNPDHEQYWEAWDEVVDSAYYCDPDVGIKYTLYQNGDLWAIRDGYSFNDEGQLLDPDENVVEL